MRILKTMFLIVVFFWSAGFGTLPSREMLGEGPKFYSTGKTGKKLESLKKDLSESKMPQVPLLPSWARCLRGNKTVIESNTVISDTVVWDRDVRLLGEVIINANAFLKIEPGVYVFIAPSGGITVQGKIMADGARFLPDGFDPDDPNTWHLWDAYPYAIKLEEGSSPQSVIRNCGILSAWEGIVSRVSLETPIYNTELWCCHIGVIQGPYSQIFSNCKIINAWSIGVIGDVNNPDVKLHFNQCLIGGFYYEDYGRLWGQDFGIVTIGAAEQFNAGRIVIDGCIIVGSYGAARWPIGWLVNYPVCNGYWRNASISFWNTDPNSAWDDFYPVYLRYDQDPFANGFRKPFNIRSDSPLIDAGFWYAWEIFPGWTTTTDNKPDEGIVDIGPHRPSNWIGPFSDLAPDGIIDFLDLTAFCKCWLNAVYNPNDVCYRADLDNNGNVNFPDFALFAEHWQKRYMFIIDPIDSNQIDIENIQNSFWVQLSMPPEILAAAIYLDNNLIEVKEGSDVNQITEIRSSEWKNGWHLLQLVTYDSNSHPIIYPPIRVFFNNLFSNVVADDYFYPDRGYRLSGTYNGNELDVNLTNFKDEVLWSRVYSGQLVDILIPSVFENQQVCQISIKERNEKEKEGNTEKRWKKMLSKKFYIRDYTGPDAPNPKAILLLPNPEVSEPRRSTIYKKMETCEARGVSYIVLGYHDVTPENITFVLADRPIGVLRGRKHCFYSGHAGIEVRGPNPDPDDPNKIITVVRPHLECWGKTVEAWPWVGSMEKYYKQRAYCWTRQTFPNDPRVPPLPRFEDERSFDLTTLGLVNSNKIRILLLDGCQSLLYPALAYTFGMFSDWNAGNQDQIALGWRNIFTQRGDSQINMLMGSGEGLKIIFDRLGQGRTIEYALNASAHATAITTVRALWGPNLQIDIGQPDSDDNFLVRGMGNIKTIKLEP